MNASQPGQVVDAIVCTEVEKSFGATRAIKGVSLNVRAGSIHALVGENGAGKSTLLGVFSGRVRPDTGSLFVRGEPITGGSPRRLRSAGLAMIYQELTMVPMLSAEENVFLGMQPSRAGFVQRRTRREAFTRLCSDLDVAIPPNQPVRELSLAQQQLIEIMRGIAAGSRILLMDEPTAALAEREREVLHRVIRDLNGRGITIVFVSHNLDEVIAMASRISVMRDGSLVADAPTGEWSKERLITAMIGKDVDVPRRAGSASSRIVVQASDVRVRPGAPPLSMDVRNGEIVGLWGLVGSGRTTFLRSLAGLETGSSGNLLIGGESAPWPTSPVASQALGICLLPDDRRRALVPNMTAIDNYWIGRRGTALAPVNRNRERRAFMEEAPKFAFAQERARTPVGRLSGGNQQKALLAKWAGRMPKLLLIDEPTRGIDVGAKSEVLTSLVQLTNDGTGIVMSSSELEEVLMIADRIIVFSHGKMVAEAFRGSEGFSIEAIVRHGFGNEVGN